jgi:TolA-binding protein
MRLFFLFFSFIFAFELNISYLKKPSLEILTLNSASPIECRKSNNLIICKFNKIPSTPTFKTKSIYFEITPIFDKNFYLYIKVKKPFILKGFSGNLYNNALINPFKVKKAKKWVVIAPFYRIKKNKGLNFYFINSPKPFVGAVDEYGNPLDIKKSAEDIIKYFAIQRAYKKRKDVLDDINEFLKAYQNSIFVPDILFLKMSILDKNNKSDEVINIGKKWIKEYAYNEYLPNVLLLIARNYSKLGFMSDASYFYQRILTEYPKTDFAYKAMIYLADQLYSLGESKKALKLYKKALFSTKDIEIASLAAMRLAQRYIDKGDVKTAIVYYQKVFDVNKEYILKDKKKAFELAKNLAFNKVYNLAIKIGTDLLSRLKKLDDLYEPLEYYLALWSFNSKNYKLAFKWIDKYLNEFPYGEYSNSVAILRDKVLFEVGDNNLTKQLANVNELIKKYHGSEIAFKALKKKIEILKKLKRYKEILEISKKSKLDKKLIKKVAKEYALELLQKDKCFEFSNVVNEYNVVLPKKYDNKVYKCAFKARDYKLASIICNKYLNSPDDKVFVKWMKRKIEALYKLKDYKEVVKGVEDLCQVEKRCFDFRLKEFFALWNLKEYKQALKIASYLNKKDIRATDAFIKIIKYALNNKNHLLAATYAKKIVFLQNYFHSYPYSPFADFIYAKYTKNKEAAIKVLKELIQRVKGDNLARAYFMLANLTDKKEYLNKCVNVKNSTLWKKLCKEALELMLIKN